MKKYKMISKTFSQFNEYIIPLIVLMSLTMFVLIAQLTFQTPKTFAASCVTGGAIQDVSGDSCPNGSVLASDYKAQCEASGGVYSAGYNGGSQLRVSCACPDDKEYLGGSCKYPVQYFCENTFGVYTRAYNGSILTENCACPDNKIFEGTGCVSPDGTDSGGSSGTDVVAFNIQQGNHQCGTGENAVYTSLNYGCKGAEIERAGGSINAIVDMAFAVFRFLSAGVGIVVIGSVIFAGIQYSASRGNPQATEASMKRVSSSVIALLFYALIYAIANFLVPGGMF